MFLFETFATLVQQFDNWNGNGIHVNYVYSSFMILSDWLIKCYALVVLQKKKLEVKL